MHRPSRRPRCGERAKCGENSAKTVFNLIGWCRRSRIYQRRSAPSAEPRRRSCNSPRLAPSPWNCASIGIASASCSPASGSPAGVLPPWSTASVFLFRLWLTMSDAVGPYQVEHRLVGDETRWVAIRARGAEWSYLTPVEAADLGRQWVERFGGKTDDSKPG